MSVAAPALSKYWETISKKEASPETEKLALDPGRVELMMRLLTEDIIW